MKKNKEVVPTLPTGSRPIVVKALMVLAIAVATMCTDDVHAAPASAPQPKDVVLQINPMNSTMLYGPITRASVLSLIQQVVGISVMQPAGEMVNVFVISPGGDVDAGKQFEQFLGNIPPLNLICVDCASAATHLLATYKNGHRYVLSNTYFLMHEMSINGTANQLNAAAMADFKAESDSYDADYARVLRVPTEEYQDRIRNTQWVLFGQDIVNNHLADGVIYIHCDENIMQVWPGTCISGSH